MFRRVPLIRDKIRYVLPPVQTQKRNAWDAAGCGRMQYINGDETDATPGESDLATMRERSSHLERNDSLCFAAIETKVYNTITHKVRPQSIAYGDDPETLPPKYRGTMIPEEAAELYRQQVEAAWLVNAEKIAANGMSFESFCALAYRTMLSRGEVLVHKVSEDDEEREFRTAYELIDGSRLATPHALINDADVDSGIRFDKYGRPVEYYIRKSSSGIMLSRDDYETLPAADIRHLFKRMRPGQKRGIPDLAVCMQAAKDRKDLADAAIIKMQNSAALTAVMKTGKPGDLESDMATGDVLDAEGNTVNTLEIQKGMLQILPYSDDIHEFKSDYPSAAYQPFMSGVKMDIARGVGISYLSLVRDATGANFSTMKATFLQDRLTYLFDRNYIRRELLDWIWANHCDECVLAGYVVAPQYKARRNVYVRASWQFGPWGMIEPTKEVEGAISAIGANLASHAQWAHAEGEDAEDIIDSNLRLEKYEVDRREEMGLKPKVVDAGEEPEESTATVEDEEDEDE